MSSEKSTKIVQSWFSNGLNREEWSEIRSLFTDDFVYHGADREFTLEQLQARISEYRGIHPDLVFGIDRIVSQGDAVGVSWHAVTRQGTTFGIGRGIMANGKIKEIWAVMPDL